MKTIYTKENFMHINNEYPLKTFSVFLDNVQYNLNLENERDYINIPIYKYSYVSFPKQFAKFVSISNLRKLTSAKTEMYEQLGFKKYKDITFAEYTQGIPDNLIYLFTENEDYLDQFQDIAINNIKPNTKLIVLRDDYMQYGSNYLFRNNGQLLIDSMKSFIAEKSQDFDSDKITIIGSRTGAKPAALYANLFPNYKLVTFNTEYDVFTSELEQYELNLNGLSFATGYEFTSFSIDNLKHKQKNESNLFVNTDKYSFVETMQLALFFAQINNNYKNVITLEANYFNFIEGDYKLPKNIDSKPLFAYIEFDNFFQKVNVYALGGQYKIRETDILNLNKDKQLVVITEDNIYKMVIKGESDD
ncbi:hypothetical protein R2F61_01360 [Mollicutes bacterium LVI A0078]|nr:hypothetical protein RZE84_01355 [Mollicutes bacterium LVI A0075]WOO91226.1 hypothetical protein R2F61_01360 [Mollicutes bacterium LVI A0078]